MAKATHPKRKKVPVVFKAPAQLDQVHPIDRAIVEALGVLHRINICLDQVDAALDRLTSAGTGATSLLTWHPLSRSSVQ